MELKVKEIKKTTVDAVDDDKPVKYLTRLESVDGEQIVRVSELEECSFTKGDLWELKRLQSQTRLPIKEGA